MTEVKPLSDETPQVVTVGGIIRWYEDQLAALKSENEKLRGALKDCADDLEQYVDHCYANTRQYPGMERRYQRDIEPVKAARAALAKG